MHELALAEAVIHAALDAAARNDIERLTQVEGSMPRLTDIPRGCAFNPRCPHVTERCRRDRPELIALGETAAACWLFDEAGARVQADG